MDGTLLANLIWIIAFLADLAIKVLALIFIPRHRKPTAAMAWLLRDLPDPLRRASCCSC